jgi:hypothetical protein
MQRSTMLAVVGDTAYPGVPWHDRLTGSLTRSSGRRRLALLTAASTRTNHLPLHLIRLPRRSTSSPACAPPGISGSSLTGRHSARSGTAHGGNQLTGAGFKPPQRTISFESGIDSRSSPSWGASPPPCWRIQTSSSCEERTREGGWRCPPAHFPGEGGTRTPARFRARGARCLRG